MLKHVLSIAAAAGVLMLAACVNTPGGAGPSKGGTSVLMKISGRPVTAEELLKSEQMRQGLRQFIWNDAVRTAASKRGVKPDTTKLDERLEQEKKTATAYGMSFEEFLKNQGITEEELRERVTGQMLFTAYVDSMVTITEEDIKTAWETDKDAIVNQYVSENHLPDSERGNVTLEKAKEMITQRLKATKGPAMEAEAVKEIIKDVNVELLSIADSIEAKKFEDLIFNFSKEQVLKEDEEVEGNADAEAAAEGVDLSSEGPEGSAATEKKAVSPPADDEGAANEEEGHEGHDHAEGDTVEK